MTKNHHQSLTVQLGDIIIITIIIITIITSKNHHQLLTVQLGHKGSSTELNVLTFNLCCQCFYW